MRKPLLPGGPFTGANVVLLDLRHLDPLLADATYYVTLYALNTAPPQYADAGQVPNPAVEFDTISGFAGVHLVYARYTLGDDVLDLPAVEVPFVPSAISSPPSPDQVAWSNSFQGSWAPMRVYDRLPVRTGGMLAVTAHATMLLAGWYELDFAEPPSPRLPLSSGLRLPITQNVVQSTPHVVHAVPAGEEHRATLCVAAPEGGSVVFRAGAHQWSLSGQLRSLPLLTDIPLRGGDNGLALEVGLASSGQSSALAYGTFTRS